MLSTRNQLLAQVKSVKTGDVVSEVVMEIGGQDLCAIITTKSVQDLALTAGNQVRALVKATSVGVEKP